MNFTLNHHKLIKFQRKHNGPSKILQDYAFKISQIKQNKYQKSFQGILFDKNHLNQIKMMLQMANFIFQNLTVYDAIKIIYKSLDKTHLMQF